MAEYHIIFRACDAVHSVHEASRPFGLDKRTLIKVCFVTLTEALRGRSHRIQVVADRLSSEMAAFFERFSVEIITAGPGNEASLARVLELALEVPDGTWVYLCEDDYLHRHEVFEYIDELIERRNSTFAACSLLGFPSERLIKKPLFIHPADYPDRYRPEFRRPSLVFLSRHCHWRQVDSSTFTFLAESSTLRRFEKVLKRSIRGANDWLLSRSLLHGPLGLAPALCVSPLPALTTHRHERVMSPLAGRDRVLESAGKQVAELEAKPAEVQRQP